MVSTPASPGLTSPYPRIMSGRPGATRHRGPVKRRDAMTPPEDRADPGALGAWRLPDELDDLASTVRRFMDSEVRPLEDTLPHDTTGLPDDLLLPLQEKA